MDGECAGIRGHWAGIEPCVVQLPSLQGSVLVVIDVYDDDDFFPATLNGDEFVDQFNLTSPTSGRTSLQGRYGRFVLEGRNHLLPCAELHSTNIL